MFNYFKKISYVFVIIFCICLNFGVDITDCQSISSSGEYNLINDLIDKVPSGSNCFSISSSNVVLDCGNYVVDSDFTGSKYPVRINSGLSNVSIQNCQFTEWNYSIATIYIDTNGNNIKLSNLILKDIFGDGIYFRNGGVTDNVLLDNITLDNISDDGLRIDSVNNILINRSNFYKTNYGIYIMSNDFNYNVTVNGANFSNNNQGVRLFRNSSDVLITGSYFFNNSGYDLYYGHQSSLIPMNLNLSNNLFNSYSNMYFTEDFVNVYSGTFDNNYFTSFNGSLPFCGVANGGDTICDNNAKNYSDFEFRGNNLFGGSSNQQSTQNTVSVSSLPSISFLSVIFSLGVIIGFLLF